MSSGKSRKLDSLFKNFSWLLLSRIINKIITLLILPITTFYLDPTSYGIITLYLVEAGCLSGFYTLGLDSFALRMIYKYERRNISVCRQYVGVFLFYVTLSGVIFATLLWPFAGGLKKIFLKNVPEISIFYTGLPILYALFGSVHGTIMNIFLSLQQNKKYFMCEMLDFIIVVPVQLIGLVWFGFSWQNIVVLQFISRVMGVIVGFKLLLPDLAFSFKRMKALWLALKFSFPYVILNVMSYLQENISQILLSRLSSVWTVGVYSLGIKFSEAFSFISRPLMTTVKPEISKRLDGRHASVQEDIRDFFQLFIQISFFIIFVISIFASDMVRLFADKSYRGAYIVVPFLMLVYLFNETNGLFQLKFIFRNKTIFFPILTALGVGLNIFFCFLFIPRFQIIGAAGASALTALATMSASYILSQRAHRTEYGFLKNLMWGGPVLLTIFVIQKYFLNSWVGFSVKILATVVYAGGLYRHLISNRRFAMGIDILRQRLRNAF